MTEKIPNLVDGDRISHAHAHAPAFFKGTSAVDADQTALGVEKRSAGIARIDRSIGLQAIGVLQKRAGGKLITMHSGKNAIGNSRLQISGKQKRIAHGKDVIARS